MDDEVRNALALIVRHVQAFLNGNRKALHKLCDILTSGTYSEETVDTALEAIIELAADEVDLESKCESACEIPGTSNAEKLPLSPEAYMYLVELRKTGAISTLAEEVLMETVSASASEEVTLDELKRALAEVSGDPLGSLLPSDEGDPPTVH
ncbi:MAG: hypothetical protein AMJ46_10330 [Latescibacteria bacterium DG_63]|nr:MAG: hypothetical protein AMJ46_10330 [Latescibacteria bacterium DG_63]